MVHSVQSKSMSQHQIALLNRALAIIARMDCGGWREMPLDLRISFARYMGSDVWTGLPDLLTMRDAALLIVRDAIARTGEFSANSSAEPACAPVPIKASAAK